MKNVIAAAILSAAAVLAFGGLAQSAATTVGSVSVVADGGATVTVATATPAPGAGESPQADTHWG